MKLKPLLNPQDNRKRYIILTEDSLRLYFEIGEFFKNNVGEEIFDTKKNKTGLSNQKILNKSIKELVKEELIIVLPEITKPLNF